MATLSAVDITSLLLVEGTAPATPAAGKQRLFVRSSDHLLCIVDSSGTVTPYGGALTNPMTTSQDIIVGGVAGAPARLAKGVAGSFLGLSNGSLAYLAGTSFPVSPATNDLYFRTDLGHLYYYDGTRWLSVHMEESSFASQDTLQPIGGTGQAFGYAPLHGGTSVWLVNAIVSTQVNTTNSGSHFWTVRVKLSDGTVLGSTFTTAADTVNTPTNHVVTIGAASGTTAAYALTECSVKTGTPGTIYSFGKLRYRLIAT